MITGFDHVHIQSGQMEETVAYFRDLLGGSVISRGESQGFTFIRMEVQGTTVAIREVDPVAAQFEPATGKRGLDHFGFTVDDMEKTLDELTKKGARILAGPNISPLGLKYAFIAGPESLQIELIEKK